MGGVDMAREDVIIFNQKRCVDIIGKVFGRLTVVQRVYDFEGRNGRWECLCECGNTTYKKVSDLTMGRTKSCGCLMKELASKRAMKHGESGYNVSKTYASWANMVQRCTNPNVPAYSKYGAVGITVCERWLSYDNFREDMGEKPTPKHTIDRIEGTKGYYKENCRWATYKEQANNINTNVAVMHKETGIFYESISMASEAYGINKGTLQSQLIRKNKSNFIRI